MIYWRSRSPIVCFHPLVTWEGEFYMSCIQWDSGLLRKAEKYPTWPGCDEEFGVTRKIVMLIASSLSTAGRAVLLEKKDLPGCLNSPPGTWESGGQICCHFSLQICEKFRWMWRRQKGTKTVFKDSEVIFPLLILVPLSDVSKVCSWRLKHFVQGSF